MMNTIKYKKFPFLLLLVQPFLSLIYALKYYKAPWAKNVVWLFVIFCGFTFVITDNSRSDSIYYAKYLKEMYNTHLSLKSIFLQTYVVEGYLDVYQLIVTFIVSKFTDNYKYLFAIYGVVYGYFYSRNIWLLVEKSQRELTIYGVIVLVVFAFIISIHTGINGVRFYTAAHIFIYGFIRYLLEQKKKYLIVSLVSIFVHFSFLLPVILSIIYIFIGCRPTIYFCFFIISFFISELNFSSSYKLQSYLPDYLADKTDYYIGSKGELFYHQLKQTQVSFFLVLNIKLFKATILLLTTYIYLFMRKMIKYVNIYKLFNAALLFYGVFNLLSFYPSIGRFLTISSMLLYASYFIILQNSANIKLEKLLKISSPAIILFLFVEIRFLADYAYFDLFLGNFFIAPYIDSSVSLWQLISGKS